MIREKHAYLLIVHEYNYVLETLIKCLDNEKNDIYIHVDRKTKEFPFKKLERCIKKSKIIFIPRIDVYWGGYSQIKAEIELLKNAKKNREYSYYHLLSGADLLLKSSDEIYAFFQKNYGKEFIGVEQKEFNSYFRIYYYHLEKLTSKRDKLRLLRKIIQLVFVYLQKLFFIKRNKKIIFFKGSNWFSITNNLVEYILKNEKNIEKIYRYTFCADEIFLQTLVMNSEFKNNIYKLKNNNDSESAMRYIDWNRGFPYIFKKEDFNILMESDMLFARKFSDRIDKDIIDMIYKKVKYKAIN